MTTELPELDFQRFWRRLQQLGLNAYEARSYLVLIGHPKFKAIELAARAHVPRQKIYEVLDSLVEKGFAQVVQEKTKLFSAVEPSLAVPSYLARRAQMLQRELTDQTRMADSLVVDLAASYSEGQGERGTLEYLRIVSDPEQIAQQYRRMLSDVRHEYLEFSRPPYAVDPLDEQLVKQARLGGRDVPAADRSGYARSGSSAAPGGIRVVRRRGSADRFVADETGGVRRRARIAGLTGSRDHAAHLDRDRV